jgi:hypothetical protein
MAHKSKLSSNQEVNPIYKLAVQNMYPNMNVDSLLEICYNTPNVDVALKMLLGIYELPELEEKVIDKNGRVFTMTSINKFEYKVYCCYTKNRTETFYFSKGIDVSTLNHENYEQFKKPWSPVEDLINHTITFPDEVIAYDYFQFKDWMTFEKYYSPMA